MIQILRFLSHMFVKVYNLLKKRKEKFNWIDIKAGNKQQMLSLLKCYLFRMSMNICMYNM